MSNNLDQSICLARWEAPSIHLHTGKVKTCCRTTSLDDVNLSETMQADDLFNSTYLKKRREEMLSGIRDASCAYCWELEKNNMPTPREGLNRFLDYREKHYGEDAKSLYENLKNKTYSVELLYSQKPTILEVSIGNVCDLKCLYCCTEYSSSWVLEEEKYTDFERPPKRDEAELKFIEIYFWQWLEKTGIHSLREICLIGGEPLLISSVDQMISRIAKLARLRDPQKPRLQLSITSNFNSLPARFNKFLEVINSASEFIDIEMRASIESYAEKAEYIRSGLRWKNMVNNLNVACDKSTEHVTVAIAATHNALSLSSFPELIDFVSDLMTKTSKFVFIHFNIVMLPKWIGTDVLPSHFSDYVYEAGEKMQKIAHGFSNALQKVIWFQSSQMLLDIAGQIERNNPSKERIDEFRKFIDMYDSRRNVNFLKVFPEFRDLYMASAEHKSSNEFL